MGYCHWCMHRVDQPWFRDSKWDPNVQSITYLFLCIRLVSMFYSKINFISVIPLWFHSCTLLILEALVLIPLGLAIYLCIWTFVLLILYFFLILFSSPLLAISGYEFWLAYWWVILGVVMTWEIGLWTPFWIEL